MDVELTDPEQKSITCPQCGKTSWNPNDVAMEYCGYCHQFHDVMARLSERPPDE